MFTPSGRNACATSLIFAELAWAQEPPDLNGVWNGATANGPHLESGDPLATNLPSRDGSLVNYERDNTLLRRADPNRPLYKAEFWQKVQKLEQNCHEMDTSYG